MKRLEYLVDYVLRNKLYRKKDWLISAFAVTRPVPEDEQAKNWYVGKPIHRPWGYEILGLDFKVSGQTNKIVLSDVKAGEPIFRFSDRITVTKEMCENVDTPVETSIGNLLFNCICILSSFGSKFPFVTGRVNIGKLEDAIALKLQDTPSDEKDRSPAFYYVDEYNKFVNSLQFLSTLSQLATISATPKGIIPPKGIKEFKAQLQKKYEGKLNDPVELAAYEKELMAFDDEFTKDDPANGTFISGKIKHTARKKMFLGVGADVGFGSGYRVTPITNSLHEGWPTEPEQFTAMMNGLRAGSFARGAETVKGGVSAKYLLRASNSFKVVDTDCGTTLGMNRLYDDSNIDRLTGRYILQGSKSLLIEKIEDAKNYLNKGVTVRSPQYCKLQGEQICKVCAGQRLSKYPTGLSIPLTEISAIILAASMKLMHQTTLSTARVNLAEAFS